MKKSVWRVWWLYVILAFASAAACVITGGSAQEGMLCAILSVLVYGLTEVEWLLRNPPRG